VVQRPFLLRRSVLEIGQHHMMSMRLECPNCAKWLKVPESARGKKCRCPGCGAVILASLPRQVTVADDFPSLAPAPALDDSFEFGRDSVPRKSHPPKPEKTGTLRWLLGSTPILLLGLGAIARTARDKKLPPETIVGMIVVLVLIYCAVKGIELLISKIGSGACDEPASSSDRPAVAWVAIPAQQPAASLPPPLPSRAQRRINTAAAPISFENRWWLLFQGQVTGPFETAALRRGVELGDFSLEDQVCAEGGNQWISIRSCLVAAGNAQEPFKLNSQ
jgi:hypothetical protein